jgi:hypothetical protein
MAPQTKVRAMNPAKTPLFSLLALSIAACVSPAQDEGLGSTEQGLVACPNFACAQNAPTLNNRPFHELAESHQANLEGFSLGTMVKNNAAYAATVVGWELRGSNRYDQLTGSELVGAYFEILHAADSKRYRVVIQAYSLMQIYAGPLKGVVIPQYILKWIETTPGAPAMHYQNLCSTPPTDRRETLFQQGESTIFFESNRYDATSKLVAAGDTNWFNLGCAGHVVSKLFLTGHSTLSSGASPLSLLHQQTALKALVADYCGDGTPFTVSGEPLYWKTSNLFMAFQSTPATFEGRWGPTGPVCLDEPRLVKSSNPLAQVFFPDAPDGTPGVIAAMQAHCPTKIPPPCSAAPGVYSFAGAYLVTANPPQ